MAKSLAIPQASTELARNELEKAAKNIENFEQEIKASNAVPTLIPESEEQTKLSSREKEKSGEVYLKPTKIVGDRAPFNEKFRAEYEFRKQYVRFIAENREIINESIDMWTKPYAGIPAEEWIVPVNKPVWGPRYVAEQIKRKGYRRLIMNENRETGSDQFGTYKGQLIVDSIVPRLDARPAPQEVTYSASSKLTSNF